MTPARSITRPMPIDPKKVIARREALELTQLQLAERAGMPQQGVARIESGARLDPQLSTAERLARALETTVDALLASGTPKKSKRGGKR